MRKAHVGTAVRPQTFNAMAQRVSVAKEMKPILKGSAKVENDYLRIDLEISDPDVTIFARSVEHLQELNGVAFYSNQPCTVMIVNPDLFGLDSPEVPVDENGICLDRGDEEGTTRYKVLLDSEIEFRAEIKRGYEPRLLLSSVPRTGPKIVVP